jgi:hypothetical protein
VQAEDQVPCGYGNFDQGNKILHTPQAFGYETPGNHHFHIEIQVPDLGGTARDDDLETILVRIINSPGVQSIMLFEYFNKTVREALVRSDKKHCNHTTDHMRGFRFCPAKTFHKWIELKQFENPRSLFI